MSFLLPKNKIIFLRKKTFFLFFFGISFFLLSFSLAFAKEGYADLGVSLEVANISTEEKIESGERVSFRVSYQNNGSEMVDPAILQVVYGNYFQNPTGYPGECADDGEELRCEFSDFDSGENGSFNFSASLKNTGVGKEVFIISHFNSRVPDNYFPNNSSRIEFDTSGGAYVSKFDPYEPITDPVTSIYYYRNINGDYVGFGENNGVVKNPSDSSGNYWDPEWSNEYPVVENSSSYVGAKQIAEGNIDIDLFTSGSSVISGDSIVFTANIRNPNSFSLQNVVAENYFPMRDFVILSSTDRYTGSGDTLRFAKSRLSSGETWKIRIIARAKNKAGSQAIRVVDHIVVTADKTE